MHLFLFSLNDVREEASSEYSCRNGALALEGKVIKFTTEDFGDGEPLLINGKFREVSFGDPSNKNYAD